MLMATIWWIFGWIFHGITLKIHILFHSIIDPKTTWRGKLFDMLAPQFETYGKYSGLCSLSRCSHVFDGYLGTYSSSHMNNVIEYHQTHCWVQY